MVRKNNIYAVSLTDRKDGLSITASTVCYQENMDVRAWRMILKINLWSLSFFITKPCSGEMPAWDSSQRAAQCCLLVPFTLSLSIYKSRQLSDGTQSVLRWALGVWKERWKECKNWRWWGVLENGVSGHTQHGYYTQKVTASVATCTRSTQNQAF